MFTHKRTQAVVLWFGGDEYEGMAGDYIYDESTKTILDGDGDKIAHRPCA